MGIFPRIGYTKKKQQKTTFPLAQTGNYKFGLGYELALEEVAQTRQEEQHRKVVAGKGN